MKEGSWSDCLESSSSLKGSIDKAKARSLLEMARQRVSFFKKMKLNEENANFVFENYYSSLLEYLHALVLANGFNVKNHVCLGYYLRDILQKENLFRIFEDCRFHRNGIIYYGTKMSFEKASKNIKDCDFLMKEITILVGKV